LQSVTVGCLQTKVSDGIIICVSTVDILVRRHNG
jgi:hypothetical protein